MGTLDTFQAARSRLVSIAYRMLGSSTDAEDVMQEAWLRWQSADESAVHNPDAWLTATVSRLCLDKLKALRVRREAYKGPWLPEPVRTAAPLDRESISLAFLVLLERLSPSERAVYLLHRVFDYTHREIGEALDMTEPAARQAFHRAEQHVAQNRPRFAVNAAEHEKLLAAFGDAAFRGDLDALTQMLAHDATLWADADGKVRGAAGKPVEGADKIARFLVGLAQKYTAPDQRYAIELINGWPALVGRRDGVVNGILTIETDGQKVIAVRNVVNPDKLSLPEVN